MSEIEADLQSSHSSSLLLVTTVELGGGRTGTVEVRAGDDPLDVARQFCAYHGLPDTVVAPLALHLQENLELESSRASPSARSLDGGRSELAGELPGDGQGLHDGDAEAEDVEQKHAGLRDPHALHAMPNALEAMTQLAFDGLPEPERAGEGEAGAAWGSTAVPAWGPGSSGCLAPAEPGEDSPVRVHERLYRDHFRQQLKLEERRRLRDLEIELRMAQAHVDPLSQTLAAARTPAGYSNYGERLYVEGRLEALKREQETARRREAEAARELDACTFRPALGPAAARPATSSVTSVELRGSFMVSKLEARVAELRRAKIAAETRECTFQPALNARSQRMTAARVEAAACSGLRACDRLYVEADRRRAKHEALAAQLPPEATFAPKILDVEESGVLRRLMEHRAGEDERGARVEDRLLERGRRYRANLAASRAALEAAVDPATGRRRFRPQLHAAPRAARADPRLGRIDPSTVGEHLYRASQVRRERAQALALAEAQRAKRDARRTFVNAASERMVARLKRERFESVFWYLARREGRAEGASLGSGQESAAAQTSVDLLAAVADEEFMDTIDPEVRTDVEFAARLLETAVGEEQEGEEPLDDLFSGVSAEPADRSSALTDEEETVDVAALATPAATAANRFAEWEGSPPAETERADSSARMSGVGGNGPDSVSNAGAGAPAATATPTRPLVDLDLFCGLMEEVLARSRGISRTYLLPMASERKKFEEPTFKPKIDPKSEPPIATHALASRLREAMPIPAHENLYATAGVIRKKLEAKRAEMQAARLRARWGECSFQPVLLSRPPPAATGPAKAEPSAKPDALEIDLENQINRAMAQLNLTPDTGATTPGTKRTPTPAAEADGADAGAARIPAVRVSLDPVALFGPASALPQARMPPELKWLSSETESSIVAELPQAESGAEAVGPITSQAGAPGAIPDAGALAVSNFEC